jgi:hypothetical protein
MTAEPPKLSYWHLWADDEGVSHQTRCDLTAFTSAPLNPGVSPQWSDALLDAGNAFFTVLPRGWVGDWHVNAAAKWIVVLSGRWFVESMDGERVVIGPGEFSFGGDQDCRADPQGRVGHRSGQVGDVPCVQLIVQNNDPNAWLGARPGAFR